MTNAFSGTRRYLALWFPFLSADRLRLEELSPCSASSDTQPDVPLVFTAKIKGAIILCAVNVCAQRQGIVPGLSLADARARQPDLIVTGMDEDADRHWLERQARQCIRWSPLVTVVPPDGITLDIAGVEHLFGGESGLTAQIEDELTTTGICYRLAIGSTQEAAQALARYAPLPVEDEHAAIRALPVSALGLDPDAILTLRRAGLKIIGDVAGRPAASIAARFGIQAVTALRRLMGEAHSPVSPLLCPAALRFERRFAEPVGHQATIAHFFLDLLHEAATALEERGLGGRRFCLSLSRSDGAQHRLVVETGLPTRDAGVVLRLFDERIGALADPLDPGFGYDSLCLHITSAEPLCADQPSLDGSEEAGIAIAQLIDRLSIRLGPGSLRRLVPQDSHIPEQAQLALPANQCGNPVSWPVLPQGEPPIRPLFLFDPPQPVEVIAEVPDGPPHRFRWKQTLHEVSLYEGPERIASEWWRRKNGEHFGEGGLTRDYYRIEDRQGRRYWIFRHGLYQEKSNPRWYLHGLFA